MPAVDRPAPLLTAAVTARATNGLPADPAGHARLWCIGGSEARGLTGLAADLATAQDLQCPCALVQTALTIQNATAAADILVISADLLLLQLQSLAKEALPQVIKIGLIASQAQLDTLAHWLSAAKAQARQLQQPLWVIWDPVLQSSLGQPLTQLPNPGALLAVTDLLTPNQPELLQLTAQANKTKALHWLCQQGVKAIWCKDGHGEPAADLNEQLWCHPHSPALWKSWPDFFATPAGSAAAPAEITTPAECRFRLSSARLSVQYRGTGCSLATAVGCALLQPMLLPDALMLASCYLQLALRQLPLRQQQLPRPGWPDGRVMHLPLQLAPTAAALPDSGAFAPLDKAPGLYPVLANLTQLEALATTGISTVQLRLKDVADSELRRQITAAIALGRKHQLQLFINDHWQLALELGAYGVHLGQEDLASADLAALQQAGLRLGISTHGYVELWQALQLRPSYVALGHLFATPTKQMPSLPQGLPALRYQQHWCAAAGIYSVAIGGISALELPAIKACGVDGAAVVRAVTHAADPASACRQLHLQWERL